MRWLRIPGVAVAAACLIALAGSRPALASEPAGAGPPVDGPKALFKDDLIENLVGDWKLTRSIRGREAESTLRAEWILNHQFLQVHMTDLGTPPEYEALLLIGYSHADSRYVIHWCDTFGGHFSGDGSGRRSGDSIEFKFQFPDGPFYNTFTWDAAAKTWTFRMESQGKGDERVPFAIDRLRRGGGA